MVRFADPEMAREARALFADCQSRSQRMVAGEWSKSHTFWRRLKQRWAYAIISQLDPYLAHYQWRGLPR